MNKIWTMAAIFIFLTGVMVEPAAACPAGQEEEPVTALLIIDVQYFYFPGSAGVLENPEAASLNAKKLLKKFRDEKRLVIHVRHEAKTLAGIHQHVTPVEGEKVITKSSVNCFKDTDLAEYLNARRVERLAICGMMTHMCVEAAVRAAHDLGYRVTLVHDACAARALKYENRTVSAQDVHLSTLATLSGYYAEVMDTGTFLKTGTGKK